MPLFKAPEDYKSPFRNYSNDDLIAIVTTDKEKHPVRAVEAARHILVERGVRFGVPQQHTAPAYQPYRQLAQQKKTATWVYVAIIFILIRLIVYIIRHAGD